MRRAATREGLVRQLGDGVTGLEVCELGRVPLGVDQREVAMRPFQKVARTGDAAGRQLDREQCRSGVKADLHRQRRRTFDMRLHGAGELAVGQAEGAAGRTRVQAEDVREACGGAECAAHRRPEEPELGACSATDRRGDIDRGGAACDETSAVHTSTGFGEGDQGREHHRHRMHHGGLVHAVPFLVMDLIAVDERRSLRRDSFAAPPDAC